LCCFSFLCAKIEKQTCHDEIYVEKIIDNAVEKMEKYLYLHHQKQLLWKYIKYG